MTTGLQAIETFYNGYRFRSRLEARWAVFFTTLGVQYQYEVQGFELGSAGRYLPDFWLTDLEHWVEVKSKADDVRLDIKCNALSTKSGYPVIRLSGDPFFGEYVASYYRHDLASDDYRRWVFGLDACEDTAAQLWLVNESVTQGFHLNKKRWCNQHMSAEHAMLRSAYFAARQARFEFGENGKRLPAVRPATPPPPSSEILRLTIDHFEWVERDFGPGIRWVFVDHAGREVSVITSPKLTPSTKARKLTEAFLGRSLVNGEKGVDVGRALIGSTAWADVSRDERGRVTVTPVTVSR